MRSQRMRQLSAKLTPSWSKHVFALRTKRCKIFTMQECSPSSTPTTAVRGKEKPSKEEQGTNEVRKSAGTSASQKGGKKPSAPKDNTSEGSSNITLNAAALGSALAEALKSSFEGLRDSMNAGFTGLGDLIDSHSVDEYENYSAAIVLSRSQFPYNRRHTIDTIIHVLYYSGDSTV